MKLLCILLLFLGIPKVRAQQDGLYYNGAVQFWNNATQKELVLYFEKDKMANFIILENATPAYEFSDGMCQIRMREYGLQITTRFGNSLFFSALNDFTRQGAKAFVKEHKIKQYDLALTGIYHYYGKPGTYKTLSEIKKIYTTALGYFNGEE